MYFYLSFYNEVVKMRTTIDINEDLIKKVMEASKVKTKKKAISIALSEYLKMKNREELIKLVGNYKSFNLSLYELEKMRER